jgi:hypothetical protein
MYTIQMIDEVPPEQIRQPPDGVHLGRRPLDTSPRDSRDRTEAEDLDCHENDVQRTQYILMFEVIECLAAADALTNPARCRAQRG